MVINKKIKRVRILCVTRRSCVFRCLRGVDKKIADQPRKVNRIRNMSGLFADPDDIQGVTKADLDDPRKGKRRSSGG